MKSLALAASAGDFRVAASGSVFTGTGLRAGVVCTAAGYPFAA